MEAAAALGEPWKLKATRLASTTQTRFVVENHHNNAFYRVVVLP